MFTTKEEKKAAEEISNTSTVISKGTVLEGNIETLGNVRIDGRIKGNIKSKAKVVLGPPSHVDGNIVAQNADVEGGVKGRIEISEMLVLKATANVHGDISTGKLLVEPGAEFNGGCRMGAAVKDIKSAENGTGTHAYRAEGAAAG